jgi:hypothetical protein
MSGHAHALAMAALDVNGPEGGPSDWGRDHLASPRGQRTAAEAEDLQGDGGTGLTAHAPRGLLEPCAGTTRLHGSEEAVGAAMRPPLSDDGAHRFVIDVVEVVHTTVGTPADHLVIESWHYDRGLRRRKRR